MGSRPTFFKAEAKAKAKARPVVFKAKATK